jgi:hypothetical protein
MVCNVKIFSFHRGLYAVPLREMKRLRAISFVLLCLALIGAVNWPDISRGCKQIRHEIEWTTLPYTAWCKGIALQKDVVQMNGSAHRSITRKNIYSACRFSQQKYSPF